MAKRTLRRDDRQGQRASAVPLRDASSTKMPTYRQLRGYALDPGFSTRLDTESINEVIYRIRFEDVKPGPSGSYIDVLDFDPASKCWYEPVDLAHEQVASQLGLTPSEGNPQFHQQFVYAVAMKTIEHFERALGRKIIWRPYRKPGQREQQYVGRLRIYPHALRDANAYYDPDKKALLFGYFTAAEQFQGTNYPGGIMFTCLSPDIVAHETTHAILDSLHPRYIEDTHADVAAFHEGFSDIVALLQRFTFRELVEHQMFATGGRLDRQSVFGELATQFGEALEGNRGALRNMIGTWTENGTWEPLKPKPTDYTDNVEAHDRGAVLVATIFDAFQRIYTHRTRDLFRIASNGTGILPEGSIGVDLVRRLAGEAAEVAQHLLHVCIRALDYCPPHDITYGDYLRALITADLDIAPEDKTGYRTALIEAFRARGIFPDRVRTLSTESLRWGSPNFNDQERNALKWVVQQIVPGIRGLLETDDREELFNRSRAVQAKLHVLLTGKAAVLGSRGWEEFLNKLGLTSRPVSELFGRNTNVEFTRNGVANNSYIPPLEVHSIRPAFRAGREGRQIEQVLITLTQRVTVNIGEDGEKEEMVFRGGCSLIFSLRDLNTVDYTVLKNIRSYPRFLRQRDYQLGNGDGAGAPSAYADRSRELRFDLLHRHWQE